jgi:hypothetical protein
MKYSVWAIWIGGAAAILLGSGWVATLGHLVFWLTLAAHVVEFLVKRPLFERAGGSMGHHFVQTLIYGLFHWKPIEDRLQASEGP